MAGSVNKVILIGNLGADPEVKNFADGGKIANLRIATSETWRDKSSGERKERTEWHRVVVKNAGLVGVVEQYCAKGQKLYIEGQIQTRKWTDQSGVEKYSTEIVLNGYGGVLTMLDKPPARDEAPQGNGYADAIGRAQPRRAATGADGLDDDIPF